MNEVERIVGILVDKVEPYLASNGGPILMLQIENEYTYHPNQQLGEEYVKWCVDMAFNTTDKVVWIMCEHNPTMPTSGNIDGNVAINTINGFWYVNNIFQKHNILYKCTFRDEHNVDGTSWPGPKWISEHKEAFPKQPLFWTEDQAWFQQWGGGTLIRDVTQISNGILRWYALGGTYHNFYMMFGGNNYARNAGKNVITAYANDAPINPYGMPNNPKYNQLKNMFGVLQTYSQCIVSQQPPAPIIVQTNIQAIIYKNNSASITFLSNIGPVLIMGVAYNNKAYNLAANSTLLLDKNSNILFNSSSLSGNSAVNLYDEQYPDCILPGKTPTNIIEIDSNWLYYSETIGKGGNLNTTTDETPIEMWNMTMDTTEYIYYTPLNISLNKKGINTLTFPSSQTPQYAYVFDTANQQLLANGFINSKFNFELYNSETQLSILVASLGARNDGYTQETYTKGLTGPNIMLNNQNIFKSKWKSEGMLYGESLGIYNATNFNKVTWSNNAQNIKNRSLTWYRSTFKTPNTINPTTFTSLAIDMSGFTKGFIYINGYNLGRYFLIESTCNGQPHGYPDITLQWDNEYCGELPLQRYYTLPVDWLKPNGNVNDIVIIEEIGINNLNSINIVYCQSV